MRNLTNRYAIHLDNQQVELCLAKCRGVYQRNIIMGREALSGATLRGKAARYAKQYKRSSRNLILRCQAAGLSIVEIVGDHNKRMLLIGTRKVG